MTKATYAVGDHVYLLTGSVRSARAEGQYQVIGLLPNDESGAAQYRVQSRQEGFERRIRASEIDAERSAKPSGSSADPDAGGSTRNWIKPLTLQTRK